MEIVSLCPLRVSSFAWQAPTGAHARTVVVKATFLLQPGGSTLAPEQEPIHEKDRPWDDETRRSIRVPSDRAPHKPHAEVVLVGHAYAPRREPVRSLVARMIVGELDKSIEVWCDRGFRIHGDQLLEGPRFRKMPLHWERAAGGPGTSNPVGMRFDAAPDWYGMVAIPNLQPAGVFVSQRTDTVAPVGFGPVAATWPGRAQRLGRLATSFQDPGWEPRPLPADFDARYFQVAPPDQQVAEIRPNERIVLENLHPDHARLVTTLPGIRPRAIVDRATGEREEVRLVADTMWIDTDSGTCCVVWRGRLGLRHAAEAGRISVWVDGMPKEAPAEHGPRASFASLDGLGTTLTLTEPIEDTDKSALPFIPGMAQLSDSDRQIVENVARRLANARRDDDDMVETLPPMHPGLRAPMPFVPPTSPPEPAPFEGGIAFEAPPGGYQEPQTVRSSAMKAGEEEPARVEVAPPPMIGPLGKAEPPQLQEKAQEKADTPPETRSAPPPPLVSNEANAKAFRSEVFPLEKCAALTASIARRKLGKELIWEAEELSASEWAAIEAYWADAIRDEAKRGKSALLERFDQAYVGQLEKERGPITVEEYAKLTVAKERATTDEELAALKLPRGAALRLDRVWLKRLANDMDLAEQLERAMDEQRLD